MKATLQEAANWLADHDPILAPIIMTAPLPAFEPHTDYYRTLVSSIIGQQLSVKAAASIRKRFVDLFDGKFPTPQQIITTDADALRSVGLSRPKVAYVQDLARHVIDGSVQFDTLEQLPNQEIVQEFTTVKGIGVWTVHMFLMFCMGRLDVLPTGDLGIRTGMQRLYGLSTLPTPEEMLEIAEKYQWSPYESAACWYIWHSLDNAPK